MFYGSITKNYRAFFEKKLRSVLISFSGRLHMRRSSFIAGACFLSVTAAVFLVPALVSRARISRVVGALQAYYVDCGSFPSPAQGLSALVREPVPPVPGWGGPYAFEEITRDAWGNEFRYDVRCPGGVPFVVSSPGPFSFFVSSREVFR